jgi:type I restriction enzyme S subunit
MSTGSAALSKLTLNPPKFLLLTMPMPLLAEQQRIVMLIDQMNTQTSEAIDLRRQTKEQAEAILKSVLWQLSQQIKPSGKLGDVLSEPPRNGWSAKCDNVNGGIAVLSLGAITGFRYRSTEFKRTSLFAREDGHFWLKSGDLLMTRSNTPELVGHAAIYDGTPTPCIYPDLMMRLTINTERVDRRFVWYWLQSPAKRVHLSECKRYKSDDEKNIATYCNGYTLSIRFAIARAA